MSAIAVRLKNLPRSSRTVLQASRSAAGRRLNSRFVADTCFPHTRAHLSLLRRDRRSDIYGRGVSTTLAAYTVSGENQTRLEPLSARFSGALPNEKPR